MKISPVVLLTFTLLVGRVSAAAEPAAADPADRLERIAADSRVVAARERIRKEKDRIVGEWIRIGETLSSSKGEEARSKLIESMMKEARLSNIHRDEKGNLIGDIPGSSPGADAKRVAVLAHLDTVVKPGADVRVSREPGILKGPGIKDDTSGLVSVLAAARAMRAEGVVPARTIQVVFTVEEEIGLLGAARYVEENQSRLSAVIAVDGDLGEIHIGATGIYWYRFHFKAPGAHTLQSYGSPSATHAAAKAISDLYDLPLNREPEARRVWLNVGMLGGGEVPNAQCRDCWFSVDLRSPDPGLLAEMDARILESGRHAASVAGVEFEAESIQKSEAAAIPDFENHPLVLGARLVLEKVGVPDPKISPVGSADSNEALKRGIPGMTIGATRGIGIHTPAEKAEIDPIVPGTEQVLLLSLLAASI